MTITYNEYKPSLALQPYVESYWYRLFEGEQGEVSPMQRCLPFGMTQIIIHVNRHTCHAFIGGEWRLLPDAFLVGIYKDAVTWKTEGPGICFGINLKPESLMRLFKVPVSSLFNDYTDLQNFLGKKVNALTDKMLDVRCPLELVRLAEEFLMYQLRDMKTESSYVDEATRLIRQSRGNISVKELSQNLYVSERQLQRVFKDNLGTSPKTYGRIIRFRSAYNYVQKAEKDILSWADVSYHCGYSDQAHFIRDFKEFAGVIPTTIMRDNRQYYQVSNATNFALN